MEDNRHSRCGSNLDRGYRDEAEWKWGDINPPMEVNMTRRKMLLMTAGATVLGFVALIGLSDHSALFAGEGENESREALIKLLGDAKVSLQQGLAACEQEGQPISGKFEVDEGKLQLSVYTAKEGKFSEILVDYVTGTVAKVEPITEGDDLVAAKAQSAVMSKSKISLKAAVDRAVAQSTKVRAVSAIPTLVYGRPVVTIVLLDDNQLSDVQRSLD